MMKWFQYELFISLRYLNSKRREKFVPFITLCSLLGIAISVLTLIVVIGVMGGFERDLKTKMISMNSPLTIENSMDAGIQQYNRIIAEVETIEHVTAAAPFVIGEALLRVASGTKGIILKGIDFHKENRVSNLEKFLKKGEYQITEKEVLIGQELAYRYALGVNDVVILNLPMRSATSFGLIPRELKCTVKGIFSSGLYDFDMNFVYMPLETYQKFLGGLDTVSGISVGLDDFDRAFVVKDKIRAKIGYPFYPRTWFERNENLFRAIRTEKVVMFIILVIAIVIAAFNISSTLVMTVMEKTRDIGIFKSLGATRLSIMKIFIFQGVMVGIIGTVIGVVSGHALLDNLEPVADFITKMSGFEVFPKDIYLFDKIPAYISTKDTMIIAVSSVVISVIASVYPAWKASILKPVEALRYE